MNEVVIYTAQEVANILKVSLSEAYTLIRRGELRAVRIGRSVRVLHEDLVAFVEHNRLVTINPDRSPLLEAAKEGKRFTGKPADWFDDLLFPVRKG